MALLRPDVCFSSWRQAERGWAASQVEACAALCPVRQGEPGVLADVVAVQRSDPAPPRWEVAVQVLCFHCSDHRLMMEKKRLSD